MPHSHQFQINTSDSHPFNPNECTFSPLILHPYLISPLVCFPFFQHLLFHLCLSPRKVLQARCFCGLQGNCFLHCLSYFTLRPMSQTQSPLHNWCPRHHPPPQHTLPWSSIRNEKENFLAFGWYLTLVNRLLSALHKAVFLNNRY